MNLFERLKNNKAIPLYLRNKGHFVVDDSTGISLLTSLAYRENHENYLIVTSNLYKAQKIYDLISSFINGDEVCLFPNDELMRAETLAASKEMLAHRIFVLDKLINNKCKILITNVASATRFLPNPELFKEYIINIENNKEYNLHSIIKQLIKSGYKRVNKIDQSLEFAIRGDILDIFSVNNDNPVRIEFFGDEVESIREFDIASQTSIRKLNRVTILPATDILLTEEEILASSDKILDVLQKDKEHLSYTLFEELHQTTSEDISNLLENTFNERTYKYYSLIANQHFSIFDYAKNFNRIFVDKTAIEQSNDLLLTESYNYLSELHQNGRIISHLEMYQDLRCLVNFKTSVTTGSFIESIDDISFNVKNVPLIASKMSDSINVIRNYLDQEYTIVISLSKKEHINLIEEQLESLKIPYEIVSDFDLPNKNKIGINAINLPNGFILPDDKIVYLTAVELFNDKLHSSHFQSKFKEASILKSFEDLNPGDYVVHEYQGIGQFIELQTLEVGGCHNDYIKIAYSGDELLYVPVNQFQLVRKYMGKEGAKPKLSHLHSKDWENTKKRIKERINELAERLMHLYLERNKVQGFAFQPDDEFQFQFEENFNHKLTHDQEQSVNEIKQDMESIHPMDRLLCGDVGFGKTEVAFRAAFKAILSGKQVAILTPTTLLCRQHYELAKERFSGFDIQIGCLNRLISEKEQKDVINKTQDGRLHLLIGTHRMLSKDVVFKDLGLLIVDEEQRFGVEQKEKLKELKSNIDVLTLTATPIPRTLQISLLGVRNMSLINTPPESRMPIQTYVAPFKLDVVKELIERELGRNGQVFYMHNNVETLYSCANKLQDLLPGISIAVAHGKMSREDIEDVMIKFYRGEIKVLVCTTIIENGIDVPNANMIIVEDSENYGLSQLYQIKGRVGRSNRIAYAYLFYSARKNLKEKALKRLEAIQNFTELGSGYKIAQRDLMIRGAGDILGPDQAGFIDSIGLEMYIKLLNETVKEKLEGKQEEKPVALNTNLSIDAYIPNDYAIEADKIELYQDIITAPTIEILSSLKLKVRDVYGKLPPQVEALFTKRNIDLLKEDAMLESISELPKVIEISLGDYYINIRGIGNILFEALIPYLTFIKVNYLNNKFKMIITKRETWLKDLENVLNSLVNVLKTHRIRDGKI